jgi:alkylated DNA repair dioxygenase AlkB
MQLSLFGRERPSFDRGLPTLKRLELTEGAWLDYAPGWLRGHQAVFDELTCDASWRKQRRHMYERIVDVPRLTAAAPKSAEIWQLLVEMSRALSERYGLPLDSVTLAYYRDGRDSVAMHGDKLGPLIDDTVVAIVSVGAPRKFLIRSASGGKSLGFSLGWGDLLAMGGTFQRSWRHGVPKVAQADPRISIMFRQDAPELRAQYPELFEERN